MWNASQGPHIRRARRLIEIARRETTDSGVRPRRVVLTNSIIGLGEPGHKFASIYKRSHAEGHVVR